MDKKVYYINNATVVSSSFDVHLVLRSISPNVTVDNKTEGVVINEEVNVIMSIEHAKAFVNAIQENISKKASGASSDSETNDG